MLASYWRSSVSYASRSNLDSNLGRVENSIYKMLIDDIASLLHHTCEYKLGLPFDKALDSIAVFVIASGSDGRTSLLEPAK